MLKKAFDHWQKHWWRYALTLGLLAGVVAVISSIVYPPLLGFVAAAVVIKGSAILSFLATLPVAAAIPAFGAVAAGATASVLLGMRAVTGVLHTLYLSVKNCFIPKPEEPSYERVVPRQRNVVAPTEHQLAVQKSQILAAWNRYQIQLGGVQQFNRSNPEHAVTLNGFDIGLPQGWDNQSYDHRVQLLRRIQGLDRGLCIAYQSAQQKKREAQASPQRRSGHAFWSQGEGLVQGSNFIQDSSFSLR